MTRVSHVERAAGRAIVVRGHDIDTDRIMPARFLKAVTFEGLEAHLFEDDRAEAARRGNRHSFDEPGRADAAILLVNANFGCGSSREHAPQAILRWGIRAVVGESFAEIFFTNSAAIGLPCVAVAPDGLAQLMAQAEADEAATFTVDLVGLTVAGPGTVVPAVMPEAVRRALVSGAWDATGLLLERYEDVERTAARLPYLTGF
jgi:3-isopropylmalate/(R)-2-methylmalate dehydratase small subunit